ncbi:MAG: hypothetical protein V4563_08145 [Pseudomonadota bacterium]
MSLLDLAAVVGALAWIPPIFVAVRAWHTRPEIRVITQPAPEIGFTTLGPILNLRVALTVTHKDIVITGIRLNVTHESGEQSFFSWRGIVQRMGTMNYPQLGAVPFEKELNVLAMKVSQKDVEERFIRFQNLEFLEQKTVLEGTSLKKLAYLRAAPPFDGQSFLKSQEMNEIYSYIKQAFSWKPGGYRVKILLESPDAFTVLDDEYMFTLSPLQVQNLSDNLNRIEQSFANEILPGIEGEQPAQIAWAWVYPEMQKVQE